jgi:sphingomyelin phosphodiesterase acid-like 3
MSVSPPKPEVCVPAADKELRGKIPMPKLFRSLLVVVSACLFPFFGCGDSSAPAPTDDFQIVAFSDLHFNPFYDKSLYPALAAADPSQWAGIFQGSIVKTPSSWGADTNYPLLVLALSSIHQKAAGSSVILYTGDLLGHQIPQTFFSLYCPLQNPPCNPNSPPPSAVTAMQTFTDNTLAFVASEVRSAAGSTPVVFGIGNIDSYTGFGPDATFLANNAQTFYQQMLNSSVDQATFMNTFTTGGYYSAQPLGSGLLVLGLNTNPFANGVPGNNLPAVTAEVTWLNSELASAQAAGQKVWLLMHVPPGPDMVTTASNAAKAGTPGTITPQTAAMMMVPDYQARLLQPLAQYSGVIALMLGAHTHMDEYRVVSGNLVMDHVPGVSPVFGNNSAFKIYSFTQNGFVPTDYTSFFCDLSASSPQFNPLYTFSDAYSLMGALDSALMSLHPRLVSSGWTQSLYSDLYNSANPSINLATSLPWNSINTTNWPIFACGINNMDQAGFISCVNFF